MRCFWWVCCLKTRLVGQGYQVCGFWVGGRIWPGDMSLVEGSSMFVCQRSSSRGGQAESGWPRVLFPPAGRLQGSDNEGCCQVDDGLFSGSPALPWQPLQILYPLAWLQCQIFPADSLRPSFLPLIGCPLASTLLGSLPAPRHPAWPEKCTLQEFGLFLLVASTCWVDWKIHHHPVSIRQS